MIIIIVAVLFALVASVAVAYGIRYRKRVTDDILVQIRYAADEAFAAGWDACASTYQLAVEPISKPRRNASSASK